MESEAGASRLLEEALLRMYADFRARRARPRHEYLERYALRGASQVAEFEAEYERQVAQAAAAATSSPPVGRVGSFQLFEQLGRGGQARVYRAMRDGLARQFAVKLLDARMTDSAGVRRFEREAVTMSGLVHDGICAVVDHGVEGEFLWFAMAFVAGVSMQKRLAAGPLSVDEAVTTFVAVAEALHHAHESGVIHRDVKPDNVMLRADDGAPVLVDFGIASASEANVAATALTADGAVLGTLGYLSPEQLEGEAADPRSDIYALGVTMHEALIGASPFEAPTPNGMRQRILTERPAFLNSLRADISRELATVVAVAMARDRGDRYQSAAALADDLRRVQRGEPIAARRAGPGRRLAYWSRRNFGWAMTIATSALALLVITLLAIVVAVRADRMRLRSEQLAGKPAFEALVAMAKTELLLPDPALVPRFEQWLERADSLLAEAPLRRRQLDELRALAEPQSELDVERERAFYALEYANLEDLEREEQREGGLRPERADYRRRIRERVAFRHHYTFADYELQIRHDVLRDHVRLLERLAQPGIVNTHTRAAVAHRLALARQLAARLSGPDVAAWRWCQDYVSAEPRYRGVRIEPIVGLVPLGVDASSGLVEFWHVLSGERPNWEGEALGRGRVVLADDGREGLVMVLLPGGAFRMGTDTTTFAGLDPTVAVYDSAYSDEAPAHDVVLAPFLLSKFEVTCAQYERQFGVQRTVVGEALRGRDPQAWLTWDACDLGCRSWGLVLPTEAQWEYACRAGTIAPFSTGWDWPSLRGYANYGGSSGKSAERDDGFEAVAPVGSFRPNAFGLYDMHGNVSEWNRDAAQPYADWPARPGDGLRGYLVGMSERGSRGASFANEPWDTRSARRWRQRPSYTSAGLGFRPARSLQVRH